MNVLREIRRGVVAGFAGTAAMATTTLLQRVLMGRSGPIDYDDSRVAIDVVQRWTPLSLTGTAEGVANQFVRFGYGSSAGIARHLMEGRVRRPAVTLFALTWVGEAMLLRSLGLAPSPWRWPRRLLATSVFQHAVYAVATDIAYRSTRGEEDPCSMSSSIPTEHTRVVRRMTNSRSPARHTQPVNRNEDGHDTTT
jgi:hypothetical protein